MFLWIVSKAVIGCWGHKLGIVSKLEEKSPNSNYNIKADRLPEPWGLVQMVAHVCKLGDDLRQQIRIRRFSKMLIVICRVHVEPV